MYNPPNVNPPPVFNVNRGSKALKKNQIGRAGGGGGYGPKVIKIEKVMNCIIYEKFVNEFKRMLRKYPHK